MIATAPAVVEDLRFVMKDGRIHRGP